MECGPTSSSSSRERRVTVIGGGVAGSAAAIAGRLEGAAVTLFEKSVFPRHKVCGEFLSPETKPLLERLGVWDGFLALGPARLVSMRLRLGKLEKRAALPAPAYGLSRYRLDELLLASAVRLGSEVRRETDAPATPPAVIARGRTGAAPRGRRLFGFKAHFTGPVNDVVELYFPAAGGYVGVSAIEDGLTNVCGLAPEDALAARGFNIDAFLARDAALAARLRPLARQWRWLTTGPLIFGHRLRRASEPGIYPAGDFLSFVDPFTGSGMLAALLTGGLAGRAAARGLPSQDYLDACRRALERPFAAAQLFRALLANGWAERLARFAPGPLLFALTRPRAVSLS